ncbi:response regulator [Parvularcula sp. ZS-1/3]|uniref:Response regulator n=1 Tax=Parvularcula mediterranea TaxID=2732508 RepID=A0A7Y3RIP2_9PROT|nr:response regulator [Parvularcula mediterranea]NNU14788.1 response regulator [Parvularcula mediterranea]
MARDSNPQETGPAISTEDAEKKLAGKTILVIEDEAFVAIAICDSFADAGANVIGPIATLDEAVEHAGGEGIDGAVVDIDLAGLDVFPAADILKRRGIPFLFQTGHGTRAELQADYPDVPVCKKPVPRGELLKAMAAIL